MSMALLFLALASLVAAEAPGEKNPPRERHPLAPSLPLLTPEQEAKIERVIDRFIDYDTGKLRGSEGHKALRDFKALGPEAIPSLIDGLNRAANLEHSCPAVIIARKLASMLGSSRDTELLEFARENIGSGVTARRHMGVIQDLRVACMLRRTALRRQGAGGPETAPLPAQSLSSANLARLPPSVFKEKLKDDQPSVRATAAKIIGIKGWRFGAELIGALDDNDAEVQQAARRALIQLAGGTDYGPEPSASTTEREEAVRLWSAWWARQTRK
jgi:HEAT repeat protein